MPTVKVSDDALAPPPEEPCRHLDHGPANESREAGTYMHTCPACKLVTVFGVRGEDPPAKPGLLKRIFGA